MMLAYMNTKTKMSAVSCYGVLIHSYTVHAPRNLATVRCYKHKKKKENARVLFSNSSTALSIVIHRLGD